MLIHPCSRLLFRTRYSSWIIPFHLRLRGYHSLWHCFPTNFSSIKGYPRHIYLVLLQGIQLDLSGFQSLLLTRSHCFLFQLLLRCFISESLYTPLFKVYSVVPQVQWLRAPTLGISPLTARPCVSQPSHPLYGVKQHNPHWHNYMPLLSRFTVTS